MLTNRVRAAFLPASKHFVVSVVVALAVASVVFFLWYPFPYREMSGGRELFVILVAVDVTCGPLLTLIVFSPSKSRSELLRDMSVVVGLQCAALGYGVTSVAHARPVFLAFEGDRFRVVSVADIDQTTMAAAPDHLKDLGFLGPTLIGVRLAQVGDPDYLNSIQLAVQGLHPSFRPHRWVDYEQVQYSVANNAKPLASLRSRYPLDSELIDDAIAGAKLLESSLGYYPLQAYRQSDWVVVVELNHGKPVAFLPLDGW